MDSEESRKLVTETGPHAPYTVIMYPKNLVRSYLDSFKASGRVNGVLLLKYKENPLSELADGFSTELSCPNRGLGNDKLSSRCIML